MNLSTYPDWLLGLVAALVFLLYLIFIILPRIRSAAADQRHIDIFIESLPRTGEAATLLGLVLAAVAVVTGYAPKDDVDKFNAILLFLSGVGFFIFLYVAFSLFVLPLSVYLSLSFISSVWYCLSLSLFALLDVLLPNHIWRFVLLLPPIGLFISNLLSLILLYRTQ